MAIVVGVRFKKPGKVYFFDPGENAEAIQAGDTLVVETVRGMELGECAAAASEVEDDTIVPPLRKVIRVATEKDLKQVENNQENERNAYTICQDKIIAHKIEMKLVDVEYAFDNSKIVFYFTANGRVDFRSLVKDLASVFKTRIELRQIGVRDEAKMLGGLGPCGREICCGAFLGDFQPVSIKMAKEQSLSLNPTKISGLCGRLMCCLKYEQDNYEEARKRLPRVGKDVMTPDGRGHVIDVNALKETAKVRIPVGDTSEVREYPASDIQRITQDQGGGERRQAPAPKKPDQPQDKENPEKADKPERGERPPRQGQRDRDRDRGGAGSEQQGSRRQRRPHKEHRGEQGEQPTQAEVAEKAPAEAKEPPAAEAAPETTSATEQSEE